MKLSLKHQLCGGIFLSIVGIFAAGCAADGVNEAGTESDVAESSSELRAEWSTQPVTVTHDIPAPDFKTLKVAKHDGFDRSVFQFDTGIPGYDVRYVTNPAQCASGDPISVTGAAKLQVVMQQANAYDYETQKPTYSPASIKDFKPNLASVKHLKMSCPGIEAETSYIVGISAKKNFRVTELKNPPRIVVDVQQ